MILKFNYLLIMNYLLITPSWAVWSRILELLVEKNTNCEKFTNSK